MKRTLTGIFVMGLAAASCGLGAELATKNALTLAAAKEIAAASEKEARANNWNVVIAILDDGANLIYLQRMDDTQIGSIDIAIGKGRTAVRMKRPSKALEDAVTGGRNVVMTIPGIVPIEGGLPILVDGKVIGGIGVSGVTSQQDAQIAGAGLKALAQ